MTTPVVRHNRKGSNEEIIRLNAVGFSLATIASMIGCHPTSITLRLKSLKIHAADTRRSFIDDIFQPLPGGSRDQVAEVLLAGPKPLSIKEYIRDLIVKDIASRQSEPVAE